MNTNKIKTFTDLNTWKEGHKLVILIYQVTKKFPREELYSLVDQMRRAAVSVTSNIAEGFGRHSYKENFDTLANQANIAHKLLQGLITSSKSFIIHTS